MESAIIVNATALDGSGALSILKQFVANIPLDNKKWVVFISPNISLNSFNQNVRIVPVENVKSMIKRIWWDTFGVIRWLKKNKINPLAAVSLQNTGFRVGKKVPSYIYYHQSIPFYPYHWNPFKKQERTFWFYKYIYPFFVRLFLKKSTVIFVQLEYIKKEFSKFFNHPENNIEVYFPSVNLTPAETTDNTDCLRNCINIFYPAAPHFYKNHRIIEQALEEITTDVNIIFTIDDDNSRFNDKRIKCIGSQPYETVFNLYKASDALIFPSYIETYGLPLLEAASIGLPIIAADLPYAREVLKGYEGVEFIEYNNPKRWAEAINKVSKGIRFTPFSVKEQKSWKQLFDKLSQDLKI